MVENIDFQSAEFTKYRDFFLLSPESLWAPASYPRLELICTRVANMAKSFAEDHPNLEYMPWIDHLTDNVIIKGYHLDTRMALAVCVTRKAVRDKNFDEMGEHINELLNRLTEALLSGKGSDDPGESTPFL